MRKRIEGWADYFAGVGIALWVAAGILYVLGNQPNERLIALAVLGVILLALYIFARPRRVQEVVTSRGMRYGSNALLVSVAFIGIIGLLNFLGTRYHYRQDLTANKTYTLSPLTVQALKDLKQPVQAIAFYVSLGRSNRQEAEDRLKEYASQSAKFTYRFVDPQAEPQIAKEYKVQFDGTIVLERGTRRENVLSFDESSLTNAILKVSQDTQPTIYFSTGHGEHSPNDLGENGYSLMKQAMEAENYKVDLLNLKALTETLPSDITALIIAGPRQPFEPGEVKYIKDYLDKNGRVFILVDPQVETGLDDLLKEWGLLLRNDLVIDPKLGFFGQAQVPIISVYRSHAITQDLMGENAFFPGARSLGTSTASGRFASALFATSDASWGETDFNSVKNQKVQFDANADVKGPLDLAYAVEATGGGDQPARLVVIGNSTFVTNGTLNARITVGGQESRIRSGNGLLFGNALHWLTGQENLIAIPPKPSERSPIFLTAEQSNFVFFSSFLLLPAAILIVGVLVWLRRR